jgi:CDP-glucose 4,6-dehydratase
MKVLVTGATGALGSNLAKRLLAEGHNVVSIRHDESPIDSAKVLGIDSKITWSRGDVVDETLVKRVISDYDIDLVYHLAALPIVRVGTRTVRPLYDVNLMGTLSILEALKEQTASGFDVGMVMMSTDKVYGETTYGRQYLETDPLDAMAPYETSKACADMTCRMFQRMGYIKRLSVVRPSNIYGPGDMNPRLIPNTIRKCLKQQPPIIYKGITYVREFTFVDDFVDAMIRVGKFTLQQNGEIAEVFNIGSGETYTQEAVINLVLGSFPGLRSTVEEPPPHTRIEIPYQALNHSKISKQLGWQAKTSFPVGLSKTIEWWKTHSELWN